MKVTISKSDWLAIGKRFKLAQPTTVQPSTQQPPQQPQQTQPTDYQALSQIKTTVEQLSQMVASMQPGDINNGPKITAQLKLIQDQLPKLQKI